MLNFLLFVVFCYVTNVLVIWYITVDVGLYAPPKASQETDVCVYFKTTNVRRFLWQMLSIPAKCHLIYTNIPDVTHHTTHNTTTDSHGIFTQLLLRQKTSKIKQESSIK